MCEICEIDSMFHSESGLTIGELWKAVTKLTKKYKNFSDIPHCAKIEAQDLGYWQGVFHSIGHVRTFGEEIFKWIE